MDLSTGVFNDFNKTWDLSMDVLPDTPESMNEDMYLNSCIFDVVDRIEENAKNENNFFGLPRRVQDLIMKYKGIKSLYEWQIDCLNSPAITRRQNLLYSLPTSGGKTLVAEILMLKELIVNNKNVILSLPYVALAQEKVRSLSPFGLDLQFYVEEYVGGSGKYPPRKHQKKRSVYVCTIEKAAGLVDSLFEHNRIDEIGMIVVDEAHLIGDGSRGKTTEMLLSKLLFAASNVHIIAMSATIGNLQEIGKFLRAHVYEKDFRPVHLTQYVKCEDKLYEIKNIFGECKLIYERVVNFNYPNKLKQLDPGCIGGLVHEVGVDNSCLVFCSTKKLCSNMAILICRAGDSKLKEVKKSEKMALLRALNEEGQGSICKVLKITIPYGVAYHHSGLTNAERKLLEEAFMAKTINCICCTSTLAAGINLPAKRVIITSPYVGKDFLKISTYKQMSGRAGRTGLSDVGESFLLCQNEDTSKVLELLKSNMDSCESRMDTGGFIRLTTDAIGLGIAKSRSTLRKLFRSTLLGIQLENEENSDLKLESVVNDCIEKLSSMDAIKNVADNEFELTTIAKAAMAGNLGIEEAQHVYCDLELASVNGLILMNYLHLFYLITPYTAIEETPVSRESIISIMSNLTKEEWRIAEHVGITELCLIQYTKHGKVTSIQNNIWHRFVRALIIFDIWNKNSVWKVSEKFDIPRGTILSFLTRTAAFASSVQRFTEALKLEKYENFPNLIQQVLPRISYCCSSELIQLMQLPSVKIGRAKQLFKAGLKTIRDVANADPTSMISTVDHLPRRLAYEIIAAAKLLMLKKAETLQEEADSINRDCDFNKTISNYPENVSFSQMESISFSQVSTPIPKMKKS